MAQDVFEDAAEAVDVGDVAQALGVAVVIVIDDARRRFVVLGRVREQAGAAKGVEDCPAVTITGDYLVQNGRELGEECPLLSDEGERGFAVHFFCHSVLVMAFAMLARGRGNRRGRCLWYWLPCSAGI